jgi:hypothetical protein
MWLFLLFWFSELLILILFFGFCFCKGYTGESIRISCFSYPPKSLYELPLYCCLLTCPKFCNAFEIYHLFIIDYHVIILGCLYGFSVLSLSFSRNRWKFRKLCHALSGFGCLILMPAKPFLYNSW